METSALSFADPKWFLALAIVPVVAGLYFWSQRRSDYLITRVVAPRLRAQLAGAVSVGRRVFKAVLMLAAFALIAVALARPQMGFLQKEIKQRGRDVIIAVDTSRSMLATDISPTRLARAKLVAQDIMNLVKGDRVGLVAFAGTAFLQAPLTLDYTAVFNSLSELDTSVIPKGGTNIAAAIRAAEEAFGKGESTSKALIILTDGEELDADGIAAAKRAKELGMRIFTLGIGSPEGSLIPLKSESGGSDFVRDLSGKPVQSRLDATRLKEIAEAGGGFYEPMTPESAKIIYEKGILPMEEVETGVAGSRVPLERYQWPLGAAIALLALWMVVGDRRRVPKSALAAVLILLTPQAWAETAIEDYQSGKYQEALSSFEQKLQAQPESDKLQFNAGTASYKSGDFAKAVDHFTKALLTDDDKFREQASYNLANSLVRRGEGAQGNDKKKADWKNAIQHYDESLKLDPNNKEAKENRDIVKKMLEDLEKQEQQQKDQQKQDQQQDQKDQKDQKDQQDQKQDQKDNQQQQQNQDQKDQKDQQKQDQKDQNQSGQSGQNQDQKDQQKQDQAKNEQDQKNQSQDKQDQQGGGQSQDQKDQEQKDQQDKQDGQQGQDKKEQEKKDEQGRQDQQKQDEKGEGEKDEPNDQQGQEQNSQPQSGQPEKKEGQNQPAPAPTPGEKKEGDLKADGGQPQGEPTQEEAQAAAEAQAEENGEMSERQARGLLNSLRSEEDRVRLMQRQENEDTLKDW